MKETNLEIDPKDMPSFLSGLATNYFTDNPEIYWKLAQCSFWITLCNREDDPND